MSRLPILCYHHVGQRPTETALGMLYVAEAQLDRQLWALERLGLRGVSVGEGLARLRSGDATRSVALTFDDGYPSTLTAALPLLRRRGFRATCYLVSDRIGGQNSWDDDRPGERHPLMTRAQIDEWVASGMEIGSHSCTHPRLQQMGEAEALREIADSRAALKATFGVAVDHFAYPFGGFTPATVELVKRSGYLSAVTTQPGTARAGDDVHRLPRLLVDGERSLARFLLHVGTPFVDLRQGRGLRAR